MAETDAYIATAIDLTERSDDGYYLLLGFEVEPDAQLRVACPIELTLGLAMRLLELAPQVVESDDRQHWEAFTTRGLSLRPAPDGNLALRIEFGTAAAIHFVLPRSQAKALGQAFLDHA